jgi:DNA-binding transcriptional MerR regulator
MFKIKEVAEMAGVSVRTLHHYHHIGLLQPESVTTAGYRLYTHKNLERLQQILFFREIGFALDDIKSILDRPDFDRQRALRTHKELLMEKKERIEKMILTVENTLQAMEGDERMENEEMFKGFNMEDIKKHQEKYAHEAREKYGKELVQQSEKRVAHYNQDDWTGIQSKMNELFSFIASRMKFGPSDQDIQTAIGEWRQFITDHFYECTPEIFRGLGELYVADPRFTKNINKFGENLAPFLREAINIYCDNLK